MSVLNMETARPKARNQSVGNGRIFVKCLKFEKMERLQVATVL